MTADARRRAEEACRHLVASPQHVALWDAINEFRDARNIIAREHAVVRVEEAVRGYVEALLAAGPEAKTPVTTPVPWLECLTVISNPIVPQGAILLHPDTLAGKPDALAYRPPDPLPPPAPTTPPLPGDAVREAAERVREARRDQRLSGTVAADYREARRVLDERTGVLLAALAASPSTVTVPDDAAVREAAEAFTVYCDVCEADRREPCHTVTTGDPAPYPHPERAVAAKLAARGGE